MKRIYLILSFLCFNISLYAQTAASYGFSALTDPFVSIAATGTPVPLMSLDDYTETGIPIGFTFNYCGVSYTNLSACSNGYISLSNSPAIEFVNLSFLIDGPGWLMPFWDDQYGVFMGNAYYGTSGIAPNRVFTLEWNNYESLAGSGNVTFQIKLYETSGVIDFHYGPSTLTYAEATIGISNDNVSDWQTLSDASAAPTALASPLFEDFLTPAPADGQIYRWAPPCVLSAIGGSLTTCPAGITTLTNDTAGGTWSSDDLSVATIDPVTGELSALTLGTSMITYTTGPGCFITAVVTVATPTAITGTLSICNGLGTLLGNPTPGGTWSTDDPLIADVGVTPGLIIGVDLGVTNINYTYAGGCVATAEVTVNPQPAGIVGDFNICQGATTTLTNTVAGGTWISSFTSVATIDNITGEVTGVLGGLTTISYIMPGTGCYRTVELTVNPLPAPITGGTSICVSGTLSLSSTTFGGTWTSSVPAVGTVEASSGLFTGISDGTTTITYTLASGCYATTVVTVATVIAPITGDMTICRGETTIYSSTTPGGTWSSSDIAVGTIGEFSGGFHGLLAGTTTVSYTVGSGCFATAVVTVDSLEPILGVASVCPGSTMTMTNAVFGGTWSSGDVSIFTVDPSTGEVTGINPGVVSITYLNPYGCITNTTVTVHPLPSAITGDMHICVGNTSTLSSAPPGGSWSHTPLSEVSIDGSTGVVTGLSVGVGEVTYTIPATGCMVTANVTVDPVPANISGVTLLCPGTGAVLTHPVAGGTWSTSDAAIVSVDASGIITGESLAGGTATISYTLPTSGCAATVVATVYPAPDPITGSLSVCVGANTTLATTSLGATWSSSNTIVATIGAATGIVSGLTPGTSTIVCYGANGCTRSVVVTVNANPAVIVGTAVVCVAATTALSTVSTGGAWSSSSDPTATVSATGIVTGVTANTVTISYTFPTGCYATRTVTVNPLPTAFTPPGANAVCEGLTMTLASTPAGGTWTSSNVTNAPVGASTGIVTGNTAGTANITYTIPTGCFRVRNITVNPLPSAISGPGSVCPGTTITLSSSPAGGTWSSSVTTVGTVNATGVVTGILGGTTTISYVLGTGCLTTTVVTVIAAPVAAITPIGDTILCPGDFVTLTSSAAAGATYIWYVGGVPIPSATLPTYVTGVPGSYRVRVSISAGCTTLSPPVNVTVVPATATITVPGGSTTTCAGTPVLLNANTGVGLTYQWELAGTAIAGATASTFNALTAGNYAVRVTNSTGCWAVSAPVTITIGAVPSNVVTASGPLTFCAGNSVILTAAAGTGYTYQWHNSAGPITGATSISYTATTTQSYHVVITNGAGCATTTTASVITVNPLPDVTITPGGPRIFCIGGLVLLSAAPGFNYQWYRNGAAIAGATNLAYAAAVSGNYRVRVTDVATGCTDMTHGDTTVSVISSPTAIPLTPARFCWGGSALLSTSVSGLAGAVGYQWMFNGAPIPGATLSTYNATVGGVYDCNISVPLSCTVLTSSVTVSEVPLPDPAITFNGTSFKTGNFYITYQWYKDLLPIPGATSVSTPATSDGNYKVAVTDTNGCQSVSAVYVLNGWKGGGGTTGIVDVNSTEIRIFPNPAYSTVHIESVVTVRAVVSGIDGKSIMDIKEAKELDISKLADGMYIITVYDAGNNLLKTDKLVKRSE